MGSMVWWSMEMPMQNGMIAASRGLSIRSTDPTDIKYSNEEGNTDAITGATIHVKRILTPTGTKISTQIGARFKNSNPIGLLF